jgi:hypothetical protein
MKRLIMLALVVLGALLLAPLGQSFAATSVENQVENIPVTGSGPDGSFAGEFDITHFSADDGVLLAHGKLSGTLYDQDGGVVKEVKNRRIAWPVESINDQPTSLSSAAGPEVSTMAVAQQTCEILSLELGPLDLNLLGLRIQLDQVDLLITAVGGAGNLLGNLLCAVVGLLDNLNLSGLLQIANLLNQILAILQ